MHKYITYVADRSAQREGEALTDFYGVGRLVVTGELTYDQARDQMVDAFKVRNLTASTAKTYVSHGYTLAQMFDTFKDVEEYADEECNGSRSMKRIVDSMSTATPKAKKSQLDVVLAALPNLTVAERQQVLAAIALIDAPVAAAA